MTPTISSTADEGVDFIIVRGETAGLVLANRLTADPEVSVLVIEAGSDRLEDSKIKTPGLATTLYNGPSQDWSFGTLPQEHICGKKISHFRGKVIGGSSAINVLALIYPSKTSIDARKAGNKGRNFNSLAPYYQSSRFSINPPSKPKRLQPQNTLTKSFLDNRAQFKAPFGISRGIAQSMAGNI